jgi:hypothetical protein
MGFGERERERERERETDDDSISKEEDMTKFESDSFDTLSTSHSAYPSSVCVVSVPKLYVLYSVLGSTSADKTARLVPLDNIRLLKATSRWWVASLVYCPTEKL